MRRFGYAILIASLAVLAIPGSSLPAEAGNKTVIRLATISPRNASIVRNLQKLDKDLKKATNGEVSIKIYPSGVAGDEKDVIRKMRVGQLDAAVLTATGLGQITRSVVVLNAPGVIDSYKELKAVQDAMLSEWEQGFMDGGFKLVAWGTGGQYRHFATGSTSHPDKVKSLRPWLWPESYVLREIWSVVGATGVPMDLPGVYGALQTGMINMVINSALGLTNLQWHGKLNHVTEEGGNMLMLGMVVSKKKWNTLPKEAQDLILEVARANTLKSDKDALKNDKRAYSLLLKRGYTKVKYSDADRKAWDAVYDKVRARLTGRIYPKELLARVKKIVSSAK